VCNILSCKPLLCGRLILLLDRITGFARPSICPARSQDSRTKAYAKITWRERSLWRE